MDLGGTDASVQHIGFRRLGRRRGEGGAEPGGGHRDGSHGATGGGRRRGGRIVCQSEIGEGRTKSGGGEVGSGGGANAPATTTPQHACVTKPQKGIPHVDAVTSTVTRPRQTFYQCTLGNTRESASVRVGGASRESGRSVNRGGGNDR